MNNKVIPAMCAALLLAVSFSLCVRTGRAQASGSGTAVAFPAILQPATPPEAIEMWRASENNPAALLPYLDRKGWSQSLRSRLGDEAMQTASTHNYLLLLHYLAVERMGDVGTSDQIPALEKYAAQSKAEGNSDSATQARLSISRIRARSGGAREYVQEMLRWLQTPDAPDGSTMQQVKDTQQRVVEGARALGVMRSVESVPALIAKRRQPAWDNTNKGFFLVRSLARIGDPRALETLGKQINNFADYTPAAQIPLEPGEPDVAWAYWQMRTQGMSQAEMIQEMLRSLADGSSVSGISRILELTGRPVVPALMEALTNPPSGPHPERAQRVAVKVLGNLRAVESVDSLCQILRNRDNLQDIRASAAHALGQIGDKSALPDLMQAAADNDLGVQTAALDSLGELKDERAEAVLLKAAQEAAHPSARYVAIKALRTAGTAGAIPILEARLSKEPDKNVRAEIGFTIRKLKSE